MLRHPVTSSISPYRERVRLSPTYLFTMIVANIPRRLQLRQASQASGRLMRWHATWSRYRRHARAPKGLGWNFWLRNVQSFAF